MLRQFFLTILQELSEATKIDGYSEFRTFWQIILPLAKPALATVALFTFINNWNEANWPVMRTGAKFVPVFLRRAAEIFLKKPKK